MIWILNYYKLNDNKPKCEGKISFLFIDFIIYLSIYFFHFAVYCYLHRNQREEDLRENHPFFDTPLFAVPRESKFRKICQSLVYARYDTNVKDPLTGKERKVQYKSLQ